MKLTQFKINFNDQLIEGDYSGNLDSKKALILVPGFGVKRDSNGFFTDLTTEFENDFIVVKMDLIKINGEDNSTTVYPLSIQSQMLSKVIEFIKEELKIVKISIIAHSQGCIVTSLLSPRNIDKIILLASPLAWTIEKYKKRFESRPGSIFNLNGLSKLKRSDGTFTEVPSEFFNEIVNIEPIELFKTLVLKSKVWFVRATRDEVISETNYDEIGAIFGLKFIELPSDHNFTGKYRNLLIQFLTKIFD